MVASLVTFQAAEANGMTEYDFYHHNERHHEAGDGVHEGGCTDGSNTSPCIITNYAISKFAYADAQGNEFDQSIPMVAGQSSAQLNISVAYPDLSGTIVDNAWLWIKAMDDTTSDWGSDGTEYLDLLKVEGQSVNVKAVEVDASKWFFKFDVKSFITGTHVSPLDALIASVYLNCGASQKDLIFQNARLDIDFHTEYCLPPSSVPLPAAIWLFGSVLIGFVSLSNRHKV